MKKRRSSNVEVLFKLGIKREKGWLYYIDQNGDVCRVPMAPVKSSDSIVYSKTSGRADNESS